MKRKFLLTITILLCILIGLSACQDTRPVDNNSLHTQTPEGTAQPSPTATPTATEESKTPTATITEASTATPTKTPTKSPTKSPTQTTTTPTPTATAKKYGLPYVLYVNRNQNVVTVYSADDQGNAVTPVKAMLCSTGRNNGTPTGTFRISEKYEWRPLNGGVYGQYACRFNGGILFHSVPYVKKDKGTLKTNEFNKLGSQASDGCVRLSVEDVKWIYDNCDVGTKVVVYDSAAPGPLGKPEGIKIPLTATWDPTDPDTNNPWISENPVMPITFSGINEIVEVQRNGQLPDFLSKIKAVDSTGKDVSNLIMYKQALDVTQMGDYVVTYCVKNITTGISDNLDVTYRVLDKTAPVVSGLVQSYSVTTETAELITKARLLYGVSIQDDGDIISTDQVTLTINGQPYAPTLLEAGKENSILFTVSDASGNTTELEIIVTVAGPTETPEQSPTPGPTETPEATPTTTPTETSTATPNWRPF